jgi:hypothetical protein
MSKRRSSGKAKSSVTKTQRVAANLALANKEGKAKDAPSAQPRNDNDDHTESDEKISESNRPKEDVQQQAVPDDSDMPGPRFMRWLKRLFE